MLDIGQLYLAEQFFAQSQTLRVSMQQELLFNVVAHLLAKLIMTTFQFLA